MLRLDAGLEHKADASECLAPSEAGLNNSSNRFRLSSDTRYQLKGEPIDERWIGRKPKAQYAWTKGPTVTMAEARAKWGV